MQINATEHLLDCWVVLVSLALTLLMCQRDCHLCATAVIHRFYTATISVCSVRLMRDHIS